MTDCLPPFQPLVTPLPSTATMPGSAALRHAARGQAAPGRTLLSRLATRGLLLGATLALSACHHRDVVETASGWYYQMEGGTIAKQRPPPPGAFAPYPKVGRDPGKVPPVPSSTLRENLTHQLEAERNYTIRTAANNGTLTPDIPPPPGGPAAAGSTAGAANAGAGAPAAAGSTPGKAGGSGAASGAAQGAAQPVSGQPASGMGATLDAAEAPEASGASPQQPPAAPAAKPAPASANNGTGTGPEIAMPAFQEAKTTDTAAGDIPIPPIPDAPPLPATVQDIDTVMDASIPDFSRPAYDLADPDGTKIRFLAGSDQLAPGQEATLTKIVGARNDAVLYVHANGDPASLQASDQSHALSLALLRAQNLADALIKLGVPPGAIRIRTASVGVDGLVSKLR